MWHEKKGAGKRLVLRGVRRVWVDAGRGKPRPYKGAVDSPIRKFLSSVATNPIVKHDDATESSDIWLLFLVRFFP